MQLSNLTASEVLSSILFTKADGKYFTTVSLPLKQLPFDRDLYEGREVMFNVTTDYVDGNLILNEDGSFIDNYQIKKISDRPPVIQERKLNYDTQVKITTQYPLTEQLNIVSAALVDLARHAGFKTPSLDKLVEMTDFIHSEIEANELLKQTHRADKNIKFESLAETNERETCVDDPNVTIIKTGRIFKTDV